MASNIIDSRERFRSRSQSKEIGQDPIESRLLASARLSAADKAAFAANLGRLAARVDPNDPISGARHIASASGLEGIWDKRKRYFRVPGEEAPSSTRDGEYGSRPATFLRLAKTAGEMIAGPNREDIVQVERNRAIRLLIEGTSFAPTFVPSHPGERTAKSLLDHFASAVCEAAEPTRIVELWRTLRDSPFSIEAFSEDERKNAAPSPYGAAADIPKALLRPYFREHVVGGRFDPLNGLFGTDWANPTIAIGLVAFRVPSRYFVLPEAVRPMFAEHQEDDEGLLSSSAREWLASVGFVGSSFPEIDYKEGGGFGWRSCELSLMRRVGLELSEGEDGRPQLHLVSWGDDRVACETVASGAERQIANSDSRKSQVRYVEFGDDALIEAVHAAPFEQGGTANEPEVVGLLANALETGIFGDAYDVRGWTETEEVFGVLTGNHNWFYPTIEQAEPLNGPIIGGSLGAALLENARTATDENSIARKLIEQTRITANSGLRFHEAMIDTYRDALRRI